MRLYYCPACRQLYQAGSAKYAASCIRCGAPTPRKASPSQEVRYETECREVEKLHR